MHRIGHFHQLHKKLLKGQWRNVFKLKDVEEMKSWQLNFT